MSDKARPAHAPLLSMTLVRLSLATLLVASAASAVDLSTKAPSRASLAERVESKRKGLKNWAFLVGVQDYAQTGELPELKYAHADVDALKGVLTSPEHGLFDPAAVTVVKSPTTQQLKVALNKFSTEARNSSPDMVLFFFSGHGVAHEGEPYLLASDGGVELLDGQLKFSSVIDSLAATNAPQRVAFLDACRVLASSDTTNPQMSTRAGNGQLKLASEWKKAMDSIEIQNGWARFTAASDGQVAYEDPASGHGVFAHFLIEGLNGEADGARRGFAPNFTIELGELMDYVKTNVYTRVEQLREEARVKARGTLGGQFTKQQPEGETNPPSVENDMVLAGVPIGYLRITATPHARIAEIRDSRKNLLELPEEARFTPVLLAARPGSYTVVLQTRDGRSKTIQTKVSIDSEDPGVHWDTAQR